MDKIMKPLPIIDNDSKFFGKGVRKENYSYNNVKVALCISFTHVFSVLTVERKTLLG